MAEQSPFLDEANPKRKNTRCRSIVITTRLFISEGSEFARGCGCFSSHLVMKAELQ